MDDAAHQTPTSALCLVLVLCSAQGLGASSSRHREFMRADSTLWSYHSETNLQFVQLHPLGIPRVFVATADALVCLDAATGQVRWTRADIKKLPAAYFGFVFYPVGIDTTDQAVTVGVRGVLTLGKRIESIDLETGEKRWESDAWPVSEVLGYLPVPGQALLLVLAKTATSKSSLLAVDLETGTVKWQADSVFRKRPEQLQVQVGTQLLTGVYAPTLFGHQYPLADTDSTLILYLSEDGPVRIEAGTGRVLWRGTALQGRDVPFVSDEYADIMVSDSVLFIASENRLVALRTADGTAVWAEPPSYSRDVFSGRNRDWARVIGMQRTPHGLLVRVAKVNPIRGILAVSLILLDPKSGQSRWSGRTEDVTTYPILRGDSAYLVAGGKLLAMDVASGSTRLIAALAFQGGPPRRLRLREDGFMVSGWESHALVGYDGLMRYERHYPTPGLGFFGALSAAVAERRTWSPRSSAAEHYIYLFTNAPDATGRRGLSVVRLDQANGSEVGRVWLPGRPKSHDIDPVTATVFVQLGDREVTAIRF